MFNQKKDFDVYAKDAVFTEMIRKLSHKSLDAEDLNFLEYYRLLEGQRDVWESQYKEEGKQIGLEEAQQQIKQAESKAQQAESKIQQAESKAQQAESKVQQTQDQAIIAMIKNTALADTAIANALGIPSKRVKELRKKTKGK